jgi:hypothetical protein
MMFAQESEAETRRQYLVEVGFYERFVSNEFARILESVAEKREEFFVGLEHFHDEDVKFFFGVDVFDFFLEVVKVVESFDAAFVYFEHARVGGNYEGQLSQRIDHVSYSDRHFTAQIIC